MRKLVAAVIVAMTVGKQAVAQAAQAGPAPGSPEIMASGRGETKISPTSASIAISVTTRAPTAAQAGADNTTRLDATLRALRAMGLPETGLTTIGYSVAQDYQMTREARTPSGFIARNTIRAEVRKLEDIGKVIDAALAAGATEIGGVQYLAGNTPEARRTALAAAVTNARLEAEAIASAAGGRLGRLIALSASGGPSPVVAYSDYEFSAMAGPTRIAPRDLTVVAMIVGRWEFLSGPGR
jgi:uncharacterized protein YggE